MESRLQKHERFLKNQENHLVRARHSAKYSSDRLDILIISLSTTTLIFSIGFVKDFIPEIKSIDTFLLKISWSFLVGALVSNLISQSTGYYCNRYEIKITNNIIRKKRGKILKGNQNRNLILSDIFDWGTTILNWISLILLIAGMIVLLIFYLQNI
jgi:hypothetical protein